RKHKTYRLRCGFDRVAPGRPHHQWEVLRVILVIDLRYFRVRQRGMEVNRYIELLGAFVDRPELLEVEKLAIRHAVQHRALESELGNGAIELVSGGLRIDGRQGGKGGKTLGIGRANLGKSIIDLTGEAGGDVSSELLGGRRAVREHLDVDACR